jgi:hypothetical protein
MENLSSLLSCLNAVPVGHDVLFLIQTKLPYIQLAQPDNNYLSTCEATTANMVCPQFTWHRVRSPIPIHWCVGNNCCVKNLVFVQPTN